MLLLLLVAANCDDVVARAILAATVRVDLLQAVRPAGTTVEVTVCVSTVVTVLRGRIVWAVKNMVGVMVVFACTLEHTTMVSGVGVTVTVLLTVVATSVVTVVGSVCVVKDVVVVYVVMTGCPQLGCSNASPWICRRALPLALTLATCEGRQARVVVRVVTAFLLTVTADGVRVEVVVTRTGKAM